MCVCDPHRYLDVCVLVVVVKFFFFLPCICINVYLFAFFFFFDLSSVVESSSLLCLLGCLFFFFSFCDCGFFCFLFVCLFVFFFFSFSDCGWMINTLCKACFLFSFVVVVAVCLFMLPLLCVAFLPFPPQRPQPYSSSSRQHHCVKPLLF